MRKSCWEILALAPSSGSDNYTKCVVVAHDDDEDADDDVMMMIVMMSVMMMIVIMMRMVMVIPMQRTFQQYDPGIDPAII